MTTTVIAWSHSPASAYGMVERWNAETATRRATVMKFSDEFGPPFAWSVRAIGRKDVLAYEYAMTLGAAQTAAEKHLSASPGERR